MKKPKRTTAQALLLRLTQDRQNTWVSLQIRLAAKAEKILRLAITSPHTKPRTTCIACLAGQWFAEQARGVR